LALKAARGRASDFLPPFYCCGVSSAGAAGAAGSAGGAIGVSTGASVVSSGAGVVVVSSVITIKLKVKNEKLKVLELAALVIYFIINNCREATPKFFILHF
jgi:hypothetical protein